MITPFSWIAARVGLGPRALRFGTTVALVVAVLIVLGGGVVRVTGSGLGCPTWPTCDGTSLAPIPELGIHGVIEFTNRTLTGLLVVAVGAAIVTARLQRLHAADARGRRDDRMLTRLAWSQFWLVVANAVAGGITVLVQLNPWVVALHFVLAMGLLATATLTWHRARTLLRVEEPPRGSARARGLAWALVVATAGLVLVGTVVSGAGPHAGATSDIHRIELSWTVLVWVHGLLAVVVLGLAVGLAFTSRAEPNRLAVRRVGAFLVVLLAQEAVGLVQSVTGIPEALVALHLLGAALVWVGALRVLLDTDTELFAVRAAQPTAMAAL